MIKGIATIAIVGMDVGDLAHLRPSLGDRHRARHAICRLHVGDAEDVVRLWYRLVEEKIGAPVYKNGRQFQLFSDRTKGWRVAA